MIPRTVLRPVVFVAGVLLAGALPLLGRSLRSGDLDHCALDGIRIPAATRARLVAPDGRERLFCCVDCVARWMERAGGPSGRVLLTDETTGREIPAAEARFVESRVAAFAPTGCFVHVFADEESARRHLEAFGGRRIETPFPATSRGDDR